MFSRPSTNLVLYHSERRGGMPDQHPGSSFFAMSPTAMLCVTQVQSHHKMRVQLGADIRHMRIRRLEEDSASRRSPCQVRRLFTLLTVENRTHSSPVIVYVDNPLCHVYLYDLHIKTTMTYKPNIPCRSSTDSHAAQNPHQRITSWHSQTTQSLSAYARQSNWQAAVSTQQSPPKT